MCILTSGKHFLRYIIMGWLFFPLLANALTVHAPLPANQAFQLSTQLRQDNILVVNWQIAPGYYLYKDRIDFQPKDHQAITLGPISMPVGITHQDDILGHYPVYQNHVEVLLPLRAAASNKAVLMINYQGCSSEGFCYPPITQPIKLKLNPATQSTHEINTNTGIYQLLNSQNSLFITLGFFLLGVLLAFTPCVFPMLPILSSLIVGHNKDLTMTKAFSLSLTYVLAMAITYALAGLMIGMAGSNIQGLLQHPIAIIGFCMLLILLALSLFGCYELELPSSWQVKISALSHRQQGGSYISVGIMGLLSSLIVSPCVSAPLVGALSYISQQGNPWLGGSTLLALGLGMGLPLLVIGTFGGSLLPRAGNWMIHVKTLFGLTLLGLAIWMLERIVAPSITIWLWVILLINAAIILGALEAAHSKQARLWKSACFILLLYGCFVALNAFQGRDNPWLPSSIPQKVTKLSFQSVNTLAQVQQALNLAKQQQKRVLLDFSADWCINCQKMEQSTFTLPPIKQALANIVLLRVDITKNNYHTQQLLQHFKVIAPPTLILFDKKGLELAEHRIIGTIKAEDFLRKLAKL